MAKLIIVIGLPGSGKSYYLRQLLKSNEVSAYYDDYQKDSYNESSNPYLSKNYGQLLTQLINGDIIAIADIMYCQQDKLAAVIESINHVIPNIEIDMRYFENDPEKAIASIRSRSRSGRVESEIAYVNEISPQYKPDSNKVRPMHAQSSIN